MLKRYIVKRYKYNPYAVPFYVEDLSGNGGTLSVYTSLSDATNIEYSTDAKHWSSTNPGVPAGGRVYMRADATRWGSHDNRTAVIYSSQPFNVAGNIMSLLFGSSFTGDEVAFPAANVQSIFEGVFYGTGVVNSRNLILPSQTLYSDSYKRMFSHCGNLIAAPNLPTITYLHGGGINAMFEYCSSLVTPPDEISGSATYDYAQQAEMFDQCTSLTHTPVIKINPTRGWQFTNMFRGCTSLNTITVECTQWLGANQATNNWVQGVAATGTFYKPADTSIPVGSNGIPNANWTVINQ